METVAVYRAGRTYSLDPPAADAERVTLVLEEGARVQGTARGEPLVYAAGSLCGVPVPLALRFAWCRLRE